MPDDLMESIEPFDISEAVDFQTAYLAGYLANKYDVTAEESIDRVNARVKRSTEVSLNKVLMNLLHPPTSVNCPQDIILHIPKAHPQLMK